MSRSRTPDSDAEPPPAPLLLKPEEAAVLLRLSRTKVYALIRSEQLVSVKIGGARRIPMAALVAYVAALVDEAA